MFRKSFKSKILLPTITVLVVLTVVLTIYVSMKFSSYSNALINQKIEANINSLKLHIHNSTRHSEAAVVSMAQNAKAVQAVKSQDHDEVLRAFAPVLDLYQVNFFTVLDSQGIVLARMHEPDQFGDSLANQQNIKDALDGKVSSYFEEGTVVKVSIRTGAPVYDTDGTLVGVVSAGVRFDTDESVDELKRLFHSDVTIFLGDTNICTTIYRDGHRIAGTKIDPNIAKVVTKDKKEYVGEADILGAKYRVFYIPLLNANHEAFATFFIGTPLAELKTEANELIRNIVGISLVVLVVAIVLQYSIISSVSEPLVALAKKMDHIENGDLNILIESKGDDEIGQASRSLQKVVNTIHRLIDDITVTISEHEKGNLEHRLDTKSFHGYYRLLADRIIELSYLGMRDQLTGIPNRRTFDMRLDLEWGRAVREKKTLSLLMLDVDKFKTYNDTYGHQQGDAALQTVAKTISLSLKRTDDLVARWGGEEFVVLLPNTDSKGALHVAEKIWRAIEKALIPCADENAAKITVSIGVHTLVPSKEDSIVNLIAKADEALYCAKAAGRNRVEVWSGS